MKILVINGSPKGKNSVTLHTALYLEALHPEHTFTVVHAAQLLRKFEQNFQPLRIELEAADLILFCYPVYTFVAPYQLHRLIELIKENGVSLVGKAASQITTSKHFYDMTAHRWLEENCFDLGMNVLKGLSADMDDLLTQRGQQEAEMFFQQLMFSCHHGDFLTPPPSPPSQERTCYQAVLPELEKNGEKDVVIVTNCASDDVNLSAMITDFRATLPHKSRVINIRDFPFSGGCLGCFQCAVSGKCVYRDGFDSFLREKIQSADAIVYAFAISDHFTHSSFKCYDDRQFCNGHRTVTRGIPAAYLISGDYRWETNLRTILEGRAEVGGTYLCGVATDEGNTTKDIQNLAANLAFALEHHLRRPANFYGVGGMKIFRDLIYIMRGLMKADHKFYKENGFYDFPQKQRGRILQMQAVGGLMAMPSVQKKLKGKMSDYIITPYQKVVSQAKPDSGN